MPKLVAGAACAGFALGLVACGGSNSPPGAGAAGRIGASIAVLRDGRVAVVDIDHASVSVLDPETLETTLTIPVGEEPRTLLELRDGNLLVASHRAGEIALVDPRAGRLLRKTTACAGPFGMAAAPDEAFVALTCEWDGRVLSVNPATLATSPLGTGLLRPRPVAVVGARVLVGEYTGGTVVVLDGARLRRTSLVPSVAPYRPALTAMTANVVSAFAVSGSRLFVAHELVNHDGNATAEPVSDDYGSVTDGNPKINPALTELTFHDGALAETPSLVLYARFDGGSRVFSGPVAVATTSDGHALVANLATENVSVLDVDAPDADSRAVASYSVGNGPSGIAVDAAGTHAYVDNAYDGSVSRLDLTLRTGPDAPEHEPEATLVRRLDSPYSPAALAGRRLFHDASNTHVTPSGVVACGSCHPEGGDDGLVWFIHTPTIPLKRRRTPDLASAKTGTEPFHWDGQFATMNDLAQHTITDLMAGDALLVDLDSIRAYIDEIVKPPLLPVSDEAAVARGQTLFASNGCGGCHKTDTLTDDALHAVLSPVSLTADDGMTLVNTPALHGVFLRAPFFHDGRSPNLDDLLSRDDAKLHGGQTLSPGDRADLIQYLLSL